MGDETQDAEPEGRNIERYIGAMDSEDLFVAERQLRELQSHPGWAMLQRLVDIEVGRLRRQMELKPLNTVEQYAHLNGAIRGMRLPRQIITDTLETARKVQAAFEQGDNA